MLWHQRKLPLHQHNTSPGFLVILFLKVVFCTKKITLNTTMKNGNNRLSDFLFFPCYEKDWDCNKSQRKQELFAHSKPSKKAGPLLFPQCHCSDCFGRIKNTWTLSAFHCSQQWLAYSQFLPSRLDSCLPVYGRAERDCVESSPSHKKQLRIKVPSSWRFLLSLTTQLYLLFFFPPGPQEKVPSHSQPVAVCKYHMHRASV